MKFLLFTLCSLSLNALASVDTISESNIINLELQDSLEGNDKIEIQIVDSINLFYDRLEILNAKSPMDLSHNDKVQTFIDSYLGKNKALISKMQGLKELYFPLFESILDQYNLPLELKYLAIVESALNPKAKSYSGATGLWQFMYLTGKEYGLDVTSYSDDRQDPIKSTKAACEYFIKLYDSFGDWNLVLAAYNGGPGYLQRKITTLGTDKFWDLYPYLRTETRNYIPTFIAVNYAMEFAEEHDIVTKNPKIDISNTDTIKISRQVKISTLANMLCVNEETLYYFNPSIKKDLFAKNSILVLPSFAKSDFLNNQESNYAFIDAVHSKEILINEKRLSYKIEKGDYLGRIAREYGVKIHEIKKWNKLTNTKLSIGDNLVLYINENKHNVDSKIQNSTNEYVIQRGDTLWGIAKKFEGLSIRKIMSLNDLSNDKLRPGTKILLPVI